MLHLRPSSGLVATAAVVIVCLCEVGQGVMGRRIVGGLLNLTPLYDQDGHNKLAKWMKKNGRLSFTDTRRTLPSGVYYWDQLEKDWDAQRWSLK